MKPTGVFVRVGSATVPATEEHIRQLVKHTDGNSYTKDRSLIQELSFARAEKEFAEKGVLFDEAQKRSLRLTDEFGQFTNLALLLSDQCEHTTKTAVFEGRTKAVFKTRREFTGSLFEQLDGILDYLDIFNMIRTEIGRKNRIETRDYPLDAIREAVLNALIHREYGLSASTFVNVYDDRIEFLTVGGLVPGVSLEAIMSGVSHSRNEALANVFYRLKLVEAYGTGLMRIFGDYAGNRTQPKLNVTDTSFMLTLPNMRVAGSADINEQEETAIALARSEGAVTVERLCTALNLGATRCYDILKKMCSEGRLRATRVGRRVEYGVPNA